MASAQRPRMISIPPLPSFSNHVAHGQNVRSPDTVKSMKSPPVATPTVTARLASAEQDYSRLPPDDLFTRLSVSEVKKIHSKLRHEADSKQEELRTMVGERYRELLQASASIITIAAESKDVTEALTEVEEASRAGESSSIQSIPRKSGVDEQDLSVLQSLSAHLKLLLDAPEQLWRLLESHNYLHAAWLFLISRVVYRSLTRDESQDDDDAEVSWSKSGIDVSEQFPLAQRQWDAISQFRPHISHKATQSLRITTRTPRETCDTLVAILLLDSIAVSETGTLFLTQRSKALRSLLAKLSPSKSLSPSRLRPPSPLSTDRRQNRDAASALLRARTPSASSLNLDGKSVSVSRHKLAKRERKEAVQMAQNALKQALDLLVGTMETIRAIYGGDDRSASDPPPLVEQMLDSVQSSSAVTGSSKKRSRHAARLSIISSFHATPAPVPSHNPSQPLTSSMILDSLPSSQLLIQFLPPSIVSYSPYIDTVSARAQLSTSAISSAATAWFDASLASLLPSVTAWFSRLDSIRSVWEARSLIEEYRPRLSSSEMTKLAGLVDGVSSGRVRELWAMGLGEVQRKAEESIASAVREIEAHDEAAVSSSPAVFGSTQIALPTFAAGASKEKEKENSFVTFRKELQSRVDARDPLLDKTLVGLEGSAHGIKKDLDFLVADDTTRDLSASLIAEYVPRAKGTVLDISSHIQGLVAASTSSREVIVFLARLSTALVGSSRFISDLVRSQDVPEIHRSYVEVFEDGMRRWRDIVLDPILSQYHTSMSSPSPSASEAGSDIQKLRGSPALTHNLLSLVDAVRSIGLSTRNLEHYRVVEKLVQDLVDRLIALEWEDERSTQVDWDIAFARRLLSAFGPSSDADADVKFQDTVDLQLTRWQVMLGPLIGPRPSSSTSKSESNVVVKQSAPPSGLLPFGAPHAQEDFMPAVPFIKPGGRFAMLLVGKSTGGGRK